jgi:hypothetical protein
MRQLKAATIALALILLLAGCFKIDASIKIDDDGSGQVDFLTALNADLVTSTFEDFALPVDDLGSTEELCADFLNDTGFEELPEGSTQSPYEEDGFCGARLFVPLAAATDHSDTLTDLLDDSTRLVKEGDNWIFESDINTDDITDDTAGAPDALFNALFGEASFTIMVDLPGQAIDGENNATKVEDDGVFTWEIDLLNPPDRLFAQTQPGSSGGGGSLLPLLLGLLALIALGALAWWFLSKRNSGGADTDLGSQGQTSDLSFAEPGSAPAPAAMPVDSTVTFDPATRPEASMPVVPVIPMVPAQDSVGAVAETVSLNPDEVQAAVAAAASRETVIDSPAAVEDIAATSRETVAQVSAEADTGAGASTDAAPQPFYDEAVGAWLVDDPARGRLRHDPDANTWNPL